VHKPLEFTDLLRLIDERMTAFRAAVDSAPSLDVQVPTCPDWTLFDLVQHLGVGRRAWAATVAAGPGATAKSSPVGDTAVPREREAISAWLADSTRQLLDALREAGPERGCWTWWGTSQSPENCGAVARHQLQEISMHTYDAELTVGTVQPRPLPDELVLDGVDEFLSTCCATTSPWPHEPATVDYYVSEGYAWRVLLSADGARTAPLPLGADGAGPDGVDVSLHCTAAELLLAMYGRIPVDTLGLEGDRRVLDRLVAWEPE
jgi:uncharacterized protein (TIGR03083 family)